MTDQIVDAVAIAIRQLRRGRSKTVPFQPGLVGLTPEGADLYRAEAVAAIHAYTDALEASGWIVIPPPSGKVNEHDRKLSSG